MKPMPNFVSSPQEIPVSLEISQHLDQFCQALEMIQSGKALPESSSLGVDLAALADVFNAAPTAIGGSRWGALFSPSYSGNGGMLNLKEPSGNQTLVVSCDRKGALYNGVWMRSGEEDSVVLFFDVVQSPPGYQLKVSGEDIEWNVSLGENLPGLEWVAPGDVLSFVPEWLAGGVEAAANTAAPAVQTILPPAPGAPEEAVSLSQQPTLIQPVSEMALILESSGQRLPLLGPLTIGRDIENAVCIADTEVSRKHAVIEPTVGGWQLRDLNSSNGTWLNGKRLTAPTRLAEGDVITFGRTRVRVEKRQE